MDISFESIEELYQRVYPALHAKRMELKRLGFAYIKEKDIWTFLAESKWKNSQNLMLSDIVDDILHVDNKLLDKYIKEKIENQEVI